MGRRFKQTFSEKYKQKFQQVRRKKLNIASHCCSVVSDSLQPYGLQHARASLFFTISWNLLKLLSIESVMPSNHLVLCCPLLLQPAIFPRIKIVSNESALHIRWPKYWSFSFSISPSNLGLISFQIDWFDLLAVQGTLQSLLQHSQFKSINSLALSFSYSPTLTSIHDHRKNHSLDQMDLCRQSNVSAF